MMATLGELGHEPVEIVAGTTPGREFDPVAGAPPGRCRNSPLRHDAARVPATLRTGPGLRTRPSRSPRHPGSGWTATRQPRRRTGSAVSCRRCPSRPGGGALPRRGLSPARQTTRARAGPGSRTARLSGNARKKHSVRCNRRRSDAERVSASAIASSRTSFPKHWPRRTDCAALPAALSSAGQNSDSWQNANGSRLTDNT